MADIRIIHDPILIPVPVPDIAATDHPSPGRDAVEKLKTDWLRDPCWDIEVTAGFEAHHHELLAFRLERELASEKAELARLRAEMSRQHPTRRIFEFRTGDEIDVDSYATLDANAQNSAALFQLRRGGFLRVHFSDDRERAADLLRLKLFRLDVRPSEGP